jgi:hypothetical protein
VTARQCPERDLNWRRHAGSGQNEAMPVPSRRLKELIEGTVDHHASQCWEALEEVTISWRGSYGYLTGYLSEDDDDTIKLCRIQYLGDDTEWAFAIWQASSNSYADAVLLDGHRTGHPNQALDTACTLYLPSTGDQPAEPLKDLRGAALAAGRRARTSLRRPEHPCQPGDARADRSPPMANGLPSARLRARAEPGPSQEPAPRMQYQPGLLEGVFAKPRLDLASLR